MPAVAEVQFKAQGSQQVVSAFNSVGSAAQSSSTKVQQNSTAMSSLGKGMKSSVSSIGQVTTAFATLSLSIVSTWRAYRDLTDAQIAVDKANLRVKKTQEAIKKTTAEIAALQKGAAKGGLEDQRRKIYLRKLTDALTAAQKKYGKNSLEAADAALKLKEAQAAGTGTSEKLKAAQAKLGIQQEQLGVQQDVAAEAQERFNDTQQNFYLSIIPTALSSLGLLTQAFKGIGGAITGGGGLGGFIKFFGPIGLAIAGLYLAFKTNFLGIKDIIGGVINWVKERFGVWQKTIQDIFTLIQKGDWAGVFNLIRVAAVKFWEDLKKSVPFFGTVETIVNAIKEGKWSVAFDAIKTAASAWWADMKKAVPFLADVEAFITGIAEGNWSKIFDAIKNAYTSSGLKAVIDSVLGENWITNVTASLQSIPLIISNMVAQAQGYAKAGNWKSVGQTISSGITEGLKASGGQQIIDTMLKTGIGPAAILAAWKDPKQRQYWYGIGQATVDGIGEAIGAVASFLDPYIAKFITTIFDPTTWTTLLSAASTTATDIGTAIISTLGSGLSTAAADPAALLTYFTDIGTSIWNGITDWMTKNMPETETAIQGLVASFTTSFSNASIDFQNMGRTMWNDIVKGMKAGMVEFTKTPLFDFTPFSKTIKDAVNSPEFKKAGEINLIPKADMKPATDTVKKGTDTMSKSKVVIKPTADMSNAMSKWNQFVKKVESTKIRVPIVTYGVANIGGGGRPGYTPGYVGPHQHGYQGTVKRPTTFLVGEGGRPEDVTVRPRGSVQRGGSGGGGGSTHITVSFEPQEFAQFIRYRINDNQGVVK